MVENVTIWFLHSPICEKAVNLFPLEDLLVSAVVLLLGGFPTSALE